MINEESHARQKQTTAFEQYIGQLQNIQRVVLELKNQITNKVTESKEIGYLKSETSRLKIDNENLRAMLNEFKVDVDQLKIDCNISKNQTGLIDKISKLEESKHIQYLNAIASVENKTIILENAIKSTNSRVDAITSENKARQDDFIALYNKTLSVESNAVKKQHAIEYHHNTSMTMLTHELKDVSQNFTNTLILMDKNMNDRIEAVQGHNNGTQGGFNTNV
ncbi:unnamed protein product [Mytilus edulis]|uniref:Uncharacterized protein n=1 Tax=Mytilus edulis TaxID=6550 RepID=A0A8S3TLH4_MYTED|nr:unnamed protein product [Mytilus edulis]